MTGKFYIYVGDHPATGTPCYFGKGSGGRIKVHAYFLKNGQHPNKHLQGIQNKYGKIVWTKLRESLSEQEAFETERALIEYFGRAPDGCLCNQTNGGDGASGHVKTAETIALIRQSSLGRKWTQEQRDGLRESLKNRVVNVSAETRARQSAAHKGKLKSPEHKAKIGNAHRGKVVSEKTRELLSVQRKGRRFSLETRARMSVSKVGVPLSDDRRRKLREFLKGRPKTKEHRIAISNAKKGRTSAKIAAHLASLNERRRGQPHSDEHNQKVKIALLAFHENRRIKKTSDDSLSFTEYLMKSYRCPDNEKLPPEPSKQPMTWNAI